MGIICSCPSNIIMGIIMSGIKLTYFNLKGRAELARLILAQAGVDYEDCRIQGEEWAELKKTFPLGQLPVLEMEGQTLGQSMTIARYLARRFGLAGQNDLDAAEADQAVDAVTDLVNDPGSVMREKDEPKKAEMMTKIKSERLPNWLKMMEALLNSKGGDHFAGKQLTWADIAVYYVLCSWILGERNFSQCPKLKKLVKTVKNLPNIKKWIETMPETPY